MKSRPVLVITLVSAVIALGQFSTSIYMPSLPAMTLDLGTTGAAMQLTLTVYLAGFALSQLALGPLSDRVGRRPVLLGGLAVYIAAGIACALARDVEELIAARLVQSLGACAGAVVGRAIVRDLYDRGEAARVMAYVGMVLALSPALAPTIGSHVHVWFGWQANFLLVAGFGVAVGLWTVRVLAETNPRRAAASGPRPGMIGGYGVLLRSPSFLAYTLCSSLVFGGLFAYISESPFVFIEMLGYSETDYGWFSLLGVGAFASASLIAGRLSQRITIPTAVAAGTATTILGGLVMVALAWTGAFTAATILGPMMVIGCGIGLVFPYATAGAMSAHPRIAGTASALLGFIQMALAAAATLIMGLLRDGTPLPMIYMIAGATLVGALPLLLLRLDRRSPARAVT